MREHGPADQQEEYLNPLSDRLDSWKEIAAYLKRGVRTVQRWEQTEKLPVHRHFHDKRGSVYAFRSEIDAWRENRSVASETLPPVAPPPAKGETPRAREALSLQTLRTTLGPPTFFLPGKRLSTLATALLLAGFAAAVVWAIAEIRAHVPAARVGLMAERLAVFPSRVAFPVSSPDGIFRALSPSSQCASSGGGETANPDRPYLKLSASQSALAPPFRSAPDISPTWSPDGHHVAFLRSLACDRASVFLAPAAGGAARKLLEVRLPSKASGPYLGWTRDSKGLVIRGGDSPDDLREWFLYSLATGEQRQLSSCEAASLSETNPFDQRFGRGSVAGS